MSGDAQIMHAALAPAAPAPPRIAPDPARRTARRRAQGQCAGPVGRSAEADAARRYIDAGWRLLARNWRADRLHGGGEIDLVMARDGLLAFVEVKSRRTILEAAEAFRPAQFRRLTAAAERFVELLGGGPRDMRFDLVACDRWGAMEVIENLFPD